MVRRKVAGGMGLYDRPYYQGDATGGIRFGFPQSAVGQLILANVVVYLVDVLLTGGRLSHYVLGFRPASLWQPWMWWQLVTYGFTHDPHGVGHILGNMLGLFFFGRTVEGVYGRRGFLAFYLTALVLGGLAWGVRALAMGASGPLMGASGAVVATVLLFVFHFPRATVYFNLLIPIPAWVLGTLYILSNLWGFGAGGAGTGGPLVAFDVHLVGALYAWAFYRTRWDLTHLWPQRRWKDWFRRRPKLRVHRASPPSDDLAERADAVLAKLHREGEASLTARERRVLEEYSRRMRNSRH